MALCGLRLHVAYALLFAFPHCLLFAPSVHGTWLLLREANPTRFAISSVLWLGKQREGAAHLVMGPSRCQGRTPGWEVPVGWGCVYFTCVHVDSWGSIGTALQSMLDGVARAAGPHPHCHQALPACHNINMNPGVDQALPMARRCAQDAVFPQVRSLTPHDGSPWYLSPPPRYAGENRLVGFSNLLGTTQRVDRVLG